MNDILNQTYWNNTVGTWLFSAGVVVVAAIVIRLFRFFIIRKIRIWTAKTSTTWDDFVISTAERFLLPVLYISAVYFALTLLNLSGKIDKIIYVVYLVFVTFYILRILSAAFQKFVHSFIKRQDNGEVKEKQASGLILIVNIVIWLLGIIFLIDNLGYNVTTLIAGLGIGGIAIALAAQAILGDLFSYFVIFFDRPFEIGDFIVIDDKAGTIEYIGIKTTRIRTLGGEQLICANTDLTNARLHNYKRLEKRRVVFTLGVTYQTTHEQAASLPGIVKSIIEAQPDVQFDRGRFSAYGDSSLNFEFVYYVMSPEYNVYMDRQQAIYLDIYAAFEKNKIEFAYPTQTLFVQPLSFDQGKN